MAALALPVALVLGLVADLAGGLVSRLPGGPRPGWRPVAGTWDEARRLVRARSRRARPAVIEALGAAAAALGGGLAAAGALGLGPGSAAVVYLSLALGVAGLHLGRPSQAGEVAAALSRRDAVLAEPAFVVALGALLLRWRAFDLDVIRATQTVVGPGISVGPTLGAVAIGVAAVVALAAGGLRLGSPPGETARRAGQGRGAGPRLLHALARWSVGGATALVVAALVSGHRLDASAATLPFVGAAVAAAVVIGGASALLNRLRPGGRAVAAAIALLMAGGAVALAVMG
jgi:hypothetical protein